ncbi:MAG: hypothetical protein PHZ09_03025 [Eubacteriales bacterium]|jgi:hypothetical protein|nr:hypothetical protein [Eubacteriales bacterium]
METETKKTAAPKLFFVTASVLAVAATVIQTLLFINFYDERFNFYNTEISGIPEIFYTAVFIASLFCAASYFAVKDNEQTKILPVPDRFVVFAAILCGFQLAAAVLFNIYYYITGIYTGITLLRVVVLITAIPAAAYFIITAFSPDPKENILIVCGFFVIIWAALYLMCVYFDMSSPLNSPVRILEQLSLITIMLYFVFEIRFLFKKPRPRLYLPVSLLAMLFISLSSISDLILTFAGFRASTQDTVFGITQAAAALYITARVRSYVMDGSGPDIAKTAEATDKIDEINKIDT